MRTTTVATLHDAVSTIVVVVVVAVVGEGEGAVSPVRVVVVVVGVVVVVVIQIEAKLWIGKEVVETDGSPFLAPATLESLHFPRGGVTTGTKGEVG